MENYIHPNLINEAFKEDIANCNNGSCYGCNDWNNCNIIKYIYPKAKMNETNFKKILNGNISKKITKEHLEELDAYNEIKDWFVQIKDFFDKE